METEEIEVVSIEAEESNSMVLDDIGMNVECDSENSTKKPRSYTCLVCGRRFRQNSGRYNHMKKVHKIFPGQDNLNVKCLEKGCNFTCSYKEKLQTHLTEVHGIKMNVLIKAFDSSNEFLQWKDEFERQEKCRFVKKSGSRIREEGIRVGYYYCSRSGTYISHSKGMKNIKKIGTSKTNNHCTASITCIELKNGRLEVKVCSTHYGHEADLQHLRLTQSQKFMIAEQLCQGVPRELVLDNVRASATSDVDKLHLISLKDVKNIEKSFGIQGVSNVKTDNVYHNLIFWVSNIMKTEHCPLVYFSEDGDFESLNHKDHDLTLVLITKGQIELLNKFGAKGIYYVSPFVAENTHFSLNAVNPIKPYSVYITVVLLVDDLNDVVPVSYMVSHKVNSNKFINLFDSIKDKVPEISARVILTDDREEIYDAWCAVFGDHPVHLWSNRFVDSDWRLNLIQIPDEDLQVTIYEQMYSFLESSDVSKLENTLEDFVLKLQSDATTKKFGDYFASKYIGCEDLWAGCYGKALIGINAQLNMENVFNQIEEVVQRKNWDRNFLVRTVQHLIKYINEKQCDRHMKLKKQIQEIPTHHNLATNIKPEAVLKTNKVEWRVNSVKDPENIFSLVSKQFSNCKSCTMFCSDCNVCAHQFKCSCKVHLFDKTMCKHIHAVALKIKPKSKNKSQKSSKKSKSNKYAEELSKQTTLWEEKGFNGKRKLKNKRPIEENEEPTVENLQEVNESCKKKRKSSNITDNTRTENQDTNLELKNKLISNESFEESIPPDIKPIESLYDGTPEDTDNKTLIVDKHDLTESKNTTEKSLVTETKSQESLPKQYPTETEVQSESSLNEPESARSVDKPSSSTCEKVQTNESAETILEDVILENTALRIPTTISCSKHHSSSSTNILTNLTTDNSCSNSWVSENSPVINRSRNNSANTPTENVIISSEIQPSGKHHTIKQLISVNPPEELSPCTSSGSKLLSNTTENNPLAEHEPITLGPETPKCPLEIKSKNSISKTEAVNKLSRRVKSLSDSPENRTTKATSDENATSKALRDKPVEDLPTLTGIEALSNIPEKETSSVALKNKLPSTSSDSKPPDNTPEKSSSCTTCGNPPRKLQDKTADSNSENQFASKPLGNPLEKELVTTHPRNEPEVVLPSTSSTVHVVDSSNKTNTPRKRGRPKKAPCSTTEEKINKK